MSLNTHLNAFLALLEERPEAARAIFGSLPQRVSSIDLATIQGRIQQARENIKCQAIKGAIRLAYDKILRLDLVTNDEGNRDSFYAGVNAVEEILAELIKTCEETEKKLGS